jgi:propionyl-CoA carboxylase alpha chain
LRREGLLAESDDNVRLVSAAPGTVTLDLGGPHYRFEVAVAGEYVFVDSDLGPVRLRALPRFPDPSSLLAPGSLLAPMPGTVIRVEAELGAAVVAGQPLVVLEAMKMEHRIAAPAPGVVTELNVRAGQQVEAGSVLVVISEETP